MLTTFGTTTDKTFFLNDDISLPVLAAVKMLLFTFFLFINVIFFRSLLRGQISPPPPPPPDQTVTQNIGRMIQVHLHFGLKTGAISQQIMAKPKQPTFCGRHFQMFMQWILVNLRVIHVSTLIWYFCYLDVCLPFWINWWFQIYSPELSI